MPYEKVKNESAFQGFGGINTKISDYLTGMHECLDLQNFDFSSPGKWTQRWGSTLYFGQTLSSRVLGIYEYEKLNGNSQLIVASNTAIYSSTGTSLTPINSLPVDSNLYSFTTFVDTLFFSNGSNGSFYKYNGTTGFIYGLPTGPQILENQPPISAFTIATYALGDVSGIVGIGISWLDVLGYRSAPFSIATGVSLGGTLTVATVNNGVKLYLSTSLIPWDYGVTAISIYRTSPISSAQYAQNISDIGELFLVRDIAFSNISYLSPNGARSAFAAQSTFLINLQFVSTDISSAGDAPAQYPLYFTLSPKYLEIYNNQVFMAGFSSIPGVTSPISGIFSGDINYQSTVFWSEVGEPEFIDSQFFAEVRTNDGDRISGLKNYQSNLMIFKQRSFHSLFGNSATDIAIQQISDQYGCLSGKAAVVYNQQLLFLDRKGIVRWDGANISIASDKIEPLFRRMNLSAAIDNAVGIHFKSRNEVWFAIPVDGSTLNNLVCVYDYITDAWTTFSGFTPSYLATGKGRLSEYTTFYGSYTGGVFNFGASLPSDNGQGITCAASSLFYRDMGNTVEKQWRRLFVDANIMGSGSTLKIDLLPDHGVSIYASRYMAMGTFQNRIDFGIPAKSLQFKFTYGHPTLPLTIAGITPESRFQRNV